MVELESEKKHEKVKTIFEKKRIYMSIYISTKGINNIGNDSIENILIFTTLIL